MDKRKFRRSRRVKEEEIENEGEVNVLLEEEELEYSVIYASFNATFEICFG